MPGRNAPFILLFEHNVFVEVFKHVVQQLLVLFIQNTPLRLRSSVYFSRSDVQIVSTEKLSQFAEDALDLEVRGERAENARKRVVLMSRLHSRRGCEENQRCIVA